MSLSGGKLAGGNPANGRVDNDFYATNPMAVEMLFSKYHPQFSGNKMLEPCVGQGHIVDGVKQVFSDKFTVTAVDLVDRGFPNVLVHDYLTWQTDDRFDLIITNPPFSLAEAFCRKSFELLNDGGIVCMFLKVQFLEGIGRQDFFNKFPPKYIYVFRNRMATWNNGNPFDMSGSKPKPWSTTMCHAWFVWEDGFSGEPVVRWL